LSASAARKVAIVAAVTAACTNPFLSIAVRELLSFHPINLSFVYVEKITDFSGVVIS
jgi:hypothetical protein